MIKYLFILIFNFQAFAQCELPYMPYKFINGTRKLSKISELKIGSYNVLNLEVSPGKYVLDPVSGIKTFTPQILKKDPTQTQEIANIILKEDLDIVVLQEIEGIAALEYFNKNFLANNYHELLIAGNDSRGIEIAFLVKKDLNLKYKFTTNKNILRKSSNKNSTSPLFSRDLPVLNIWPENASGADPPGLIIMGNHLKSQRNRGQDIRSVALRTEQVEQIVDITKSYQRSFPESPLILTGDFNADIPTGVEFKKLFENNLYADAFDIGAFPLNREERFTHSFHPRNEATQYNQLDGFLLNQNAQTRLIDAKVYRYLNPDGSKKPIPLTFEQRNLNPSDHYPIIMKLSLSP